MGYFLDLLLERKKLKPETLKIFRVGVSEESSFHSFNFPEELEGSIMNKSQIIIPFYSFYGKILGCTFRVVPTATTPKYITPIDNKKNYLYNMRLAVPLIVENNSAIIVEGCFDVQGMWQAGFKNTVASMGTSLSDTQLCTLRRFCQKVYILYDNDTAGQKRAVVALNQIIRIGMDGKILKLKGMQHDPDEFLAEGGESAVNFIKEQLI